VKYAFHFVFLLVAFIFFVLAFNEGDKQTMFWTAVSMAWSVAWRMTDRNKTQATWGRYRE